MKIRTLYNREGGKQEERKKENQREREKESETRVELSLYLTISVHTDPDLPMILSAWIPPRAAERRAGWGELGGRIGERERGGGRGEE